MTFDDDNHVLVVTTPQAKPIVMLVIAFLRAVERFRAAAAVASHPDGQLDGARAGWIAAAEALNWADAVDEYLRAADRHRPKEQDWVDDLAPDSKELWLAFQHARNVAHHRWWEVLAVEISMSGGRQTNTFVWAPLPPNKRTGERAGDRTMREAYERVLSGRPVLETLDELAQIMWPYRRWAITQSELEQPGCVVGTPIVLDPEGEDNE